MKYIAGIAGALLFAALLAPHVADAKNSGSGAHGSHSHSSGPGKHRGGRAKAKGVARDSRGRIARSSSARQDFKNSHPCPKTAKSSGACPSYVIDHVTPLERGGADSPGNMQWQTKKQAKIKDKTE